MMKAFCIFTTKGSCVGENDMLDKYFTILLKFRLLKMCVSFIAYVTGRDQLCHFEGSQIQPGNAHVPPMAGQQTSLRSQFF